MGAEDAASALLGPFSIGLKAAMELSKDAGAQGRLLAVNLLSQQCSAKNVSAMETALEDDKNEIVRAGAAKALGICGNAHEIPRLTLLVVSEKYPVQLAAAATIIRLSTTPAPPTQSLKKK
jgi:HEAT repeat protein